MKKDQTPKYEAKYSDGSSQIIAAATLTGASTTANFAKPKGTTVVSTNPLPRSQW